MQLLTNAVKFDWSTWFMGIMGAITSGVANSIFNIMGTTTVAPQTFNIGHPRKLVEAMAFSLVGGTIFSLAKFLQTHPTPEQETPPGAPQKEDKGFKPIP